MTAKPLYAIGRFIIYLSDTALGRIGFVVALGTFATILALSVHDIAQLIGVPHEAVKYAGAAIIGVFVALLTYVEITAVRERRRRVVENLRTVAELNHVLRNALQSIQYAAKLSADDEHVRIINNCVQRIDTAIRDLFPVVGDPRRSHER